MNKLSKELTGMILNRFTGSKDKTILDVAIKPSTTVDSTVFLPMVHKRLLPELSMTVLNGIDRGRVIELEPGKNTFGRKPTNKINFSDASISSNHGVIEYNKEGMITVYDTASRNGISVNGKTSPVLILKPGDVVQIGSLYLRVGGESSKNPLRYLRNIPVWARYAASTVAVAMISMVIFSMTHAEDVKAPSQPAKASVTAKTVSRAKPTYQRRVFVAQAQPKPSRQINLLPSRLAEAEEAMERRDYNAAFITYQEILRFESGNAIATQGMKNLQSVAARLIEEAIMLSVTDVRSASEKLDTAMKIVEVKSELYEQAKELSMKWRKA